MRPFGADVGGDLNGHVGHIRDGYEMCHGGQGFGTGNEEGGRILDFAGTHDLDLVNTFSNKPPTHLITYSPAHK